ncbi:Pex12 amino terminal region-domain-containing protein [Cercophora newfieldiana]|uniref:RING-type E3 ubiquitin transferase n=1 Tax=Cercophora newfieldiana TaxID=92897 RepID=A0AA39YRX2_9PEZI|nr:Pex12 amino terminal region-domain-containing protein [Cercophora newfieldiana]
MASPASAKRPPPPLTSSPYPYAAAPDIIRAHQKDAYFQGILTTQISDLHRRLRGARSAHAWASETRTFADALYLSFTTLLGNRTLGEEYCDLVQVEELSAILLPLRLDNDPPSTNTTGAPRLPSFARRAGYIITSILLPHIMSRLLPSVRTSLRRRLQGRLTRLTQQGHGTTLPVPSTSYRVQRYLLTHLSALTSGAHLHALVLATFYFSGAYYSLSKRIWGLRYVFTRRIEEGQGGRAGYEVLGVLLVVQMIVRGYMHLREQLSASQFEDGSLDSAIRERAFGSAAVNVSLDENAYSSNNELLPGTGQAGSGNQRSLAEIGASTHTPVPKGGRARYDLAVGDAVMGWIKGRQQRKCTLCLEELKDPAATQCGHVFCWACIGDWIREKPECPLCRRQALAQHVLPLRAV